MKILFVIDKYYPRPYANALCAQELIRAFQKRGFEIDIIAFQDSGIEMPKQYEKANVYGIKPDLRLRLFYYADNFSSSGLAKIAKVVAHFVSKTKGIIMLPFWPLQSCSFPVRILNKIEALYRHKHYDAIVSIFGPFEGSLAVTKFKQKHANVPCAIYAVDSTSRSGVFSGSLNGRFSGMLMWEKLFMETNDAFFYMQSRTDFYKKECYRPFGKKLIPVDLPRLKFEDLSVVNAYDFGTDGENWVYAGAIGSVHYNPEKMIEYFLKLPQNKTTLHLFCRGASLQVEQAVEQSEGRIVLHGYVDAETLKSVFASADILVTVKTSNQVSAKIFECISYGKPIVHFSGCPEDPDVAYYQKYPLAFVVKTYKADVEQSGKRLMDFLERIKGTTVSQEELKRIYKKSTPEYSVKLLCEKLGLDIDGLG